MNRAQGLSIRGIRSRDDDKLVVTVILALGTLALLVFLLLPLAAVLAGSVRDESGAWSLRRFIEITSDGRIGQATWNTLWTGALVTCITLPLAFLYAYALERTCLPLKGLWRLLGLSPLLGPSLIGAIAFIQWFGTQGVLKGMLGEMTIYGPLGIVMATVFASFPHALLILSAALANADARLYEAAEVAGASAWRKFLTVTLPGARYGVISAALVVFSYSVSELGIPKVIGGNFPVLAVDLYVQIVGRQDFGRGAVLALILLFPVFLAFVIDRLVRKRQHAALTSRSVPFVPRPDWQRDVFFLACCLILGGAMVAVLGMAVYSSLVRFWPYDLSWTLRHYVFGLKDAGVLSAYTTSVGMSVLTAMIGTPFIFMLAHAIEKGGAGPRWLKSAIQAAASLPMGIPGLVLGIGYILFFNHPSNPLNFLYHSLALMVCANVIHFYTPSHLTAMTALKGMDREFEAVASSLHVPQWRTLWRVTIPVCLPSILDIFRYLFVNAMTTVSVLVFLYGSDTIPASVSILHLDEAGETGPAAAMATLIVLTTAAASILHAMVSRFLLRRQVWRNPRQAD